MDQDGVVNEVLKQLKIWVRYKYVYDREEAFSAASFGVAKAIHSFDPARSDNLAGYLFTCGRFHAAEWWRSTHGRRRASRPRDVPPAPPVREGWGLREFVRGGAYRSPDPRGEPEALDALRHLVGEHQGTRVGLAMTLVCQGFSGVEIANKLGISGSRVSQIRKMLQRRATHGS